MTKLKHPWNCCQECGRKLDLGAPAHGAPAKDGTVDSNGRSVLYVYTHIKKCPGED